MCNNVAAAFQAQHSACDYHSPAAVMQDHATTFRYAGVPLPAATGFAGSGGIPVFKPLFQGSGTAAAAAAQPGAMSSTACSGLPPQVSCALPGTSTAPNQGQTHQGPAAKKRHPIAVTVPAVVERRGQTGEQLPPLQSCPA